MPDKCQRKSRLLLSEAMRLLHLTVFYQQPGVDTERSI